MASKGSAIPTFVGMGGTDFSRTCNRVSNAEEPNGPAGKNPEAHTAGLGGRGSRARWVGVRLVFEQRLGARGDVELLVNAMDIFADGIIADVQFPGNLLVTETFGQQGKGF